MRTLPLVQFLSTNGDGTGTTNAIGDYSTPDDFYIEPPAAQDYVVTCLIVHIADDEILAGEYGGLEALTNGVRLKAKLCGTTYYLDGGVPIKFNAQWGSLCFDVEQKSWAPTPTQESLVVRLAPGAYYIDGDAPPNYPGLLLRGYRDDQLIVTLSDDLSGLDIHRFLANGTKLLNHISAANQG